MLAIPANRINLIRAQVVCVDDIAAPVRLNIAEAIQMQPSESAVP